jgi:SAM-dependent methyltransferase
LALREPADIRARDENLATRLARVMRHRSPLRILDLGCGTGANFRYLAPRLGGDQEWQLVDSDSTLLARIRGDSHCSVSTCCLDLSTGLDELTFAPDVLVTASALLDLVSEKWLEQLVERCRSGSCAALFAITYDGGIDFSPEDADDSVVRRLVNRHQLRDKGFGRALGPAAAHRVCDLLIGAGFEVFRSPSDWDLLPSETLLQEQLIEGWAGAAAEVEPAEGERFRLWARRRLEHVARGMSRISVGHEDVLALPPAVRD